MTYAEIILNDHLWDEAAKHGDGTDKALSLDISTADDDTNGEYVQLELEL